MVDTLAFVRSFRVFEDGHGTAVIRTRQGKEYLLPARLARALRHCTRVAPLEQQALELAGRLGMRDSGKQLNDLLGRLVQAGIIGVAGAGAGPAGQAERIARLGVATRLRSESLARGLQSYARNLEEHHRACEMVVVSDSKSDAAESEERAALRPATLRSGLSCRYAGMQDKTRFAQMVALEAQVAPELAEFALLDPRLSGYTHGANKNALLLHFAGERYVAVDDDTVCLPASAGLSPGLKLSSEVTPIQIRVFEDERAVLDFIEPAAEDFLGTHDQSLGARFGTLLSRSLADTDARSASPGLLEQLEAEEATVAVTWSGLYGDSGSSSPFYYLFLRPEETRYLTRSEQAYRLACIGRWVWKGVQRLTVSDTPFFQSAAAGYDGRCLLPPFMPVLRAADATFAVVLRLVLPEACIGYLPWAIQHSPTPARQDAPDAVVRTSVRFLFSDLLGLCLMSYAPSLTARRTEDRYAHLGRHLIELAALPLGELKDVIREPQIARTCRLIGMLERQRRQHGGQPHFWVQDVDRTLALLRASLQDQQAGVPQDLLGPGGSESAWDMARKLIDGYGRLLAAWPALYGAARSLKERGISLAPRL